MSYLNSLLSSIGGSTAAPNQSSSATAPRTIITSDKSRSTTPNVVPPQKRKAEAPPGSEPPAKVVKTEASVVRVKPELPAAAASKPVAPASSRPAPPSSKPALPSRPHLKSTTSTSSLKPNGTTTTSIITSKTITKPLSETTRPVASRTASATTITPNRPPAKSSYRAILERAEAAKKATAEQLQIKNKPVAVAPKLSHKERLAKEEESRRKAKPKARSGDKAAGTSRDDRTGLSKPISKLKVEEEIVKPKKAPVDLGYKGTMRPNPTAKALRPAPKSTSSYTGTSRTAAWIDSSKQARPPDEIDDPYEKRYRYASETEEEDDDDDDGEDKPLGFWDMEEEEEASLRAAREEDARALREEKEHQTDKMKRKKALERMIASRAGK